MNDPRADGLHLYRWPESARYGKPVPKKKFYEHSKVTAAVRERFVTEVRQIVWAYKLAGPTINLPASADVSEIQVFRIETKRDDVSDAVLTAIDKAVRSPVIFEVARDGEVRLAATYKAAAKPGVYFTTAWMSADAERRPLPAAINLASLYSALLASIAPVATQAGEDVATIAERVALARALERDIAALERKLRNEPQLNRKVELRRTMKTKQATLASLTSATPGGPVGQAQDALTRPDSSQYRQDRRAIPERDH